MLALARARVPLAAGDFRGVDFRGVDFFAEDFFAVDLLAVDLLAVDLLAVDLLVEEEGALRPDVPLEDLGAGIRRGYPTEDTRYSSSAFCACRRFSA